MVKDAEAHAAEDKKKKELVEAKNHAEALIHSTEKQLVDNASNAAVGAVKADIEKAIAAAKDAVKGEDVEAIKSATNALTQVAMKIGDAIYELKREQPEPVASPTKPHRARRRARVARTTSWMPTSRKSRTTRRSRPDVKRPLAMFSRPDIQHAWQRREIAAAIVLGGSMA